MLSATSYLWSDKKEVINGGYVYGTIDKTEQYTNDEWRALGRTSNGKAPFGHSFSFELRDSWPISSLESVFKLIKWNDPNRFLWLIDYYQDPDTWEEERDKFLSDSPDWVKDFILPDEEHLKLLEQMKHKK